MDRKTVDYEIDKERFKGYLVHNEIVDAPRPGILIAPAWKGLDDFAKQKANDLAKLGYVAFVADLYGNGKVVESNEDAAALMTPLFIDRQKLRQRIIAAYETLKKQARANPKQIGAIGFCFGGLTVIELLRSGTDVKGVVSFHGVLGATMGDQKANLAPNAEKLKGDLLILHGNDDPLVSASDIADIQKEFTDAGVNWEMDIFGHAKHAFTNESANDDNLGLKYNERAAARSWSAMKSFFNERLT